jgi:N-methylhydantoinase B
MAATMMRAGYSAAVRNLLDFSTGVFDARGRLLAQGLGLPLHLGSMPDAIATVLRIYYDDLGPGDVVALNDPFDGGMHLPDIFLFEPVHRDGHLVGLVGVVAHHTDVGGSVPGSSATGSPDIHSEGVRIPCVKLWRRNKADESLLRLILANVRLPRELRGDLEAQRAACATGRSELLEIVEMYDGIGYGAAVDGLVDQAYSSTMTKLASIPAGKYHAVDYIEASDGHGEDVEVRVEVTSAASGLVVDFTGSSAQVPSAINATLSFTKSAVYLAVKALLGNDIRVNEGFIEAIDVIVPGGSIVNLQPPAACGARGVTGYRVVDTVFRALAEALPSRVPAAGEGGNSGVRLGGYVDGHPYVLFEAIVGSRGGGPTSDGIDGVAPLAVNLSNNPVELVEREFPVRVEQYGLIPDTGGAGHFRGGLSITRELTLLRGPATLSIRSDRRRVQPYGLQGGRPGAPSANLLWRQERAESLETKLTRTLEEGERIQHTTAGAGGWGDPFTRPPAAVLHDVLEGKVSLLAAASEYGVVIDPEKLVVDEAATRRRRESASEG